MMPLTPILVDSGFLYALYERADPDAEAVACVAELYDKRFIIPYVVLTEVAFLFRRESGVMAVARFVESLAASGYQYEGITPDDQRHVSEIMGQYADAKFDFVDCCLMAIAERLNITTICTLDQRDFTIYRPRHVKAWKPLP
jgi:predicted nucleic acid-binding protein